jgi:hypothetical protein
MTDEPNGQATARLTRWAFVDVLAGVVGLVGLKVIFAYATAFLWSWLDPNWADEWPGFYDRSFYVIVITEIVLTLVMVVVIWRRWKFVGIGALLGMVLPAAALLW